MIRRIALLLLLVTGALPTARAQENRDDLTPLDIDYTVSVNGDDTRVRVDLRVRHVRRPTLRVAMPNWTPGAYGIGRYGERVTDLAASGAGGAEVAVTRLDHQTWSLDTSATDFVHVAYTVDARRGFFGRRGGEEAPLTGFQISGPSTYLYVEGAKELPVTVRYRLPEGWRLANGLLPGAAPDERRARDYDTFIDAPTIVGRFIDRTFEVAGTPFRCVFFNNEQQYDFDVDGFVEVCRKIVAYQGKLYGSYPFGNYVFLFTLPGGGGLEHLNSTSIGLDPRRMKENVTAGASVTAHEFFHAWNVKRIRPVVLGPFDYARENYTGNLWVSEGWTSYYGDLTMARTGIIERREFLDILAGAIRRELNKESRKTQSVYWASRNVWHRRRGEPPRVDYYGKGEILGACIDLEIRHATKNAKSLDDVMRFMNRWFAERGVGFEEGDVERACTAISNHDFRDFFARYVYGTLDPPLARCLGYAGIDYREERSVVASLPFNIRRFGRRAVVVGGGAGPRDGRGGEGAPVIPERSLVTAIDGEPYDPARLRERHPGDKVTVAWDSGGKKDEAQFALVKREVMEPTLAVRDDLDALQRAILEDWLGRRE